MKKPLRVTGTVGPGQHLASHLGCPTANLMPEQGLVIPQSGVYLGMAYLLGESFPSLICVGAGREKNYFKIEVHILDKAFALEGKRLTVDLLKKWRELIPWPGEEEMRKIIQKDMEAARAWAKGNGMGIGGGGN